MKNFSSQLYEYSLHNFASRWIDETGIKDHWIDQDSEEPESIFIYGKGVESERAQKELTLIRDQFKEFDLYVGEYDGDYIVPLDHCVVYTGPGESRRSATGDIVLSHTNCTYYVLTTAHIAMMGSNEKVKYISRQRLSYQAETPAVDGLALYDYEKETDSPDSSEPFFTRCLHDTLILKISAPPTYDTMAGRDLATILPIRDERELEDLHMIGVDVEINGKRGTIEKPIESAAKPLKHRLRFKLKDGETL